MTYTVPKVGQYLRDKANNGAKLFHVADVFHLTGPPAMILEWLDNRGNVKGQVFTARDWESRWEVVPDDRTGPV